MSKLEGVLRDANLCLLYAESDKDALVLTAVRLADKVKAAFVRGK